MNELIDNTASLERHARSTMPGSTSLTFLGDSDVIRALRSVVRVVAVTETSVLVHGESGTGKALLARAIHAASQRKDKPFVLFDCATVGEGDAETFGKAVRQAWGGTLVLDEIGALSVDAQTKLLQALEDRAWGARIVALTTKDLEDEVSAGHFRGDLLHRIQVVQIDVPPLRARGADTLLLARHFVEQAATRLGKAKPMISDEAAERLMAYDWPGNVRELASAMERAVALAKGDLITLEDLPARVQEHHTSSVDVTDRAATSRAEEESILTLDEMERRHIFRALVVARGSKTRAARMLGLDRTTLYRKLQRYAGDQGPVGKCDAVDSCDGDAPRSAVRRPNFSQSKSTAVSEAVGLGGASARPGGCS